jgi:hypothetical protein
MTIEIITVAPEYLSIYVAGKRKISPPVNLDYGGLAATRDCITVPCLYWNDGDTTITVGQFGELDQDALPDFDGVLNTPEKMLMLSDANTDLLDIAVPTAETRIRIWIDHPTEPENIFIAWG